MSPPPGCADTWAAPVSHWQSVGTYRGADQVGPTANTSSAMPDEGGNMSATNFADRKDHGNALLRVDRKHDHRPGITVAPQSPTSTIRPSEYPPRGLPRIVKRGGNLLRAKHGPAISALMAGSPPRSNFSISKVRCGSRRPMSAAKKPRCLESWEGRAQIVRAQTTAPARIKPVSPGPPWNQPTCWSRFRAIPFNPWPRRRRNADSHGPLRRAAPMPNPACGHIRYGGLFSRNAPSPAVTLVPNSSTTSARRHV